MPNKQLRFLFSSLLVCVLTFASGATVFSVPATANPLDDPLKKHQAKVQKQAQQKAQQARYQKIHALFDAAGLKTGKIMVRGAKKTSGKAVKGAQGFKKRNLKDLKRKDFSDASQIVVYERHSDGSITRYDAVTVKSNTTAAGIRDSKRTNKKAKNNAAKTSGSSSADTLMHNEQSYEPEVVVEEQIVVEDIVIEVAETETTESESGSDRVKAYREAKAAEQEAEIQYNDIDMGEINATFDGDPSLLEHSKESGSQWQEIRAEGEASCTNNEDTFFTALGNASAGCTDGNVEYSKAYRTDTLSCEKKYPSKGDLQTAFRHQLTESCYACPKGFKRSANPDINASDACIKNIPAKTEKSKAEKLGKTTNPKPHKDAFKDPRNGGEWWKCPSSKPRRTLEKVTSKKACATKLGVIPEKLSSATKYGPVNNPKPSGAFKDPRNGGEYWKCPNGYSRSAAKVTASDACVKTIKAKTEKRKASLRGEAKLRCDPGDFQHGTTGICYSCPVGYTRTLVTTKDPSKEPEACSKSTK